MEIKKWFRVQHKHSSIPIRLIKFPIRNLFIFAVICFALLMAPVAYGETTSINLSAGWNLISFPKLPPASATIETVLADISPNVRIVWGYDNESKTWLKYRSQKSEVRSQTEYGNSNNLETIEAGKGYWVYMDASGNIDLSSWTAQSKTVSLTEGWNLIGYNGTDDTGVTTALNSINGKWDIIWNWENGAWKAKHQNTATNVPVTALTNLNQGKAYWLKIRSGAGTFDYNAIAHYTLTVTKSGTGNGTVTDAPSNANINCGQNCTFHYNEDTTVALTATPDANSSFTGWSDACTGSGVCTVTMNNQKGVNADFQLNYSDISISPTSYSFANVKINTTSPSKVFTITNAGKASLVISSVTISGTNAGEFTQTNNCTTVGVASSCTINVNFKPTSEGAKNATLKVSSNDPDTSNINVSISGTGIESASGIWGGSFTSNVVNKTYTILGVITENGEGRFLSDEGAQFTGNIFVSGSTLTSTVTAFAPPGYVFVNGSTYGTVQFNGTVKTKNSLTGTYSGVGDSGTFNLTYDSIYERGSSLSWVSGNWANSDPSGYSHHLTVNANGTLTGYNSYGCTFSGNVTIINPSYDAYHLDNVSISSCQGESSVFNGTYNGLGVLWDYSTTNDTFTIGISKSNVSMVLAFRRQ